MPYSEEIIKKAFENVKNAFAEMQDIASAPHASIYDYGEVSKDFNKAIYIIQRTVEDANLIKY